MLPTCMCIYCVAFLALLRFVCHRAEQESGDVSGDSSFSADGLVGCFHRRSRHGRQALPQAWVGARRNTDIWVDCTKKARPLDRRCTLHLACSRGPSRNYHTSSNYGCAMSSVQLHVTLVHILQKCTNAHTLFVHVHSCLGKLDASPSPGHVSGRKFEVAACR